jgi:hypothetical protein
LTGLLERMPQVQRGALSFQTSHEGVWWMTSRGEDMGVLLCWSSLWKAEAPGRIAEGSGVILLHL